MLSTFLAVLYSPKVAPVSSVEGIVGSGIEIGTGGVVYEVRSNGIE